MALEYKRLSDRILFAFELALEQKDLKIAGYLMDALEESLNRTDANGQKFTERRDTAPEYEAAMEEYTDLKIGKPA